MTTMNKSIRSGLLAGVAVAAIAAGAPTDANATAYAAAWQKIFNLTVSGVPVGWTQTVGSASTSSQLRQPPGGTAIDGAPGSETVTSAFSKDRSINYDATDPCDDNTSGKGPNDACRSIALSGGSVDTTENTFNTSTTDNIPTFQGFVGAPAAIAVLQGTGTQSYAYSDNLVTDNIINKDNPRVGSSTEAGFGGEWESLAETAILGDKETTTNTKSTISQTFQFTTSNTADVTVTVEFDLFARTNAFVSADEQLPPALAKASQSLAIQLTRSVENGASFGIGLGQLSQQASASKASNDLADFAGFSEDGANLSAFGTGGATLSTNADGSRHVKIEMSVGPNFGGTPGVHTLQFTSTVTVEAQAVPEPATLGLMGAGLLGLGALARRRRRKAA